jgi:predicted permease
MLPMNDLRFAVRQLRKSAGFTTVALLTLAMGIGACTAIFSVVNGVLLRPLGFPEPGRVMVIRETFLPRLPEFSVASGKYFEWQKQASSWESLAALGGGSYNLTGGTGEPVRLVAMRLTASTLPTFRVAPALGRNFSPEEDVPGKDNVAILSHGLWVRQFGGRPDVLNQSIQLDGRSFTVIGVMPEETPLPERVEIVTPAAFTESHRQNFGGHSTQVIGRIRPGVTIEQALAELTLIADRLGKQYPESKGWGVKLIPILESAVGEVRPVLLSLLGAVGLLLLIACANVANLLLARATSRSREMAVRVALGASRARIVRQLLVESVLLALVAGALGTLVARAGLVALMALAPESLPRASRVAVDSRALAFTCGLAVVTGVCFGLAPAFQAARVDLNHTLKDSGRGTSEGRHRQRLRGALVVGELAIALVLLAGAGLLMRSFARLQSVKPGFRPENALAATVSLPPKKYESEAQRAAFATEAINRLAGLPGVRAVGVTQRAPFAGGQEHRGFTIEGRRSASIAERPITNHYTVSSDYFDAMGIPVVKGRPFDLRDIRNAPRVAIINESIARKFFADVDPLGKRITITNGADAWREIVGIAGDIKNQSLDGEVTLQTYEPFVQQPGTDLTFVVRTAGPNPGLPAAIRATIYSLDRDQPVARMRQLTDFVAQSIGRQRFAMTLFSVFSAVALMLAAVGTYGVMAYSVNQRTGEIGIRMALGAQSGNVLRLILTQGGRLIVLGMLVGLAGALLLTRFLESLLFGVRSYDPLTFAAIALLLSATAAVACLLPARRASKVDPMTALRGE